ncbi:hypothetical protein [Amycolatopsis balhimycina]|uniref:hypothetical protein n=2 Tax=Amycolatopsis balhimycina TaxID=208443 RepID=UPI0012FBCEF5|nr:hypothetical protein [Amycolatopsis balhimycina]
MSASIAAAAMGMASFATPAQAEPVQHMEKDRHCVVNLSDAGAPMACYDTFTEAVATATGGRIADAPDNAAKALGDARFAARLNAAGVKKDDTGSTLAASSPVSIMFDDADFGGDSLTYTADHDCTGPTNDVDFRVHLVQANWNDRFGSYKAFRNCFLSLFEDLDWTGASIGFAGTRTDLGILDDETSSIRWS